ncbi:UDP-galactopyranose mutase [Kiritimatiellota bacterium B12222]|nr:UDP-galactopyranose mutase [Kiritimatiellota bacterium B12222]
MMSPQSPVSSSVPHACILVVGAGFSGAVVARELAEAGLRVKVIDQRPHIAGNCFTQRDEETQIMVHHYGPHIFNTDREEVWAYVNRFATFGPFINRPKATTRKGVFSLPVNLHTLNQLFDKRMSPAEAQKFVEGLGDKSIQNPQNFEEQALSMLGPLLYETFFKGYTIKQWGEDPRDLPASIFKRLPIRFDYNDNYYSKKYQGIPLQGYTALVGAILDHPLIEVELNCGYERSLSTAYQHTVYTGSLDRYFEYAEGQLGYRTVYWEEERVTGDAQGVACMNYPDPDVPWTRKVEHKHFTPWEQHDQSVLYTEFSKESTREDELFYPKRLARDKEMLARYQALADQEQDVTFLGRLGTYRYLDMDLTIAEALALGKSLGKRMADG